MNVGTLAVSRYHQLKGMFALDDKAVVPDHDFPFRQFKLCPSGYAFLELTKKQRSKATATAPSKEEDVIREEEEASAAEGGEEKGGEEKEKADDFVGYILDTLNRLHILAPHTGVLNVVTRAVRYHPSTPMTHANDLYKLLNDD